MERFDPNDFARWLRQRAATRRARQGNISFRHEDFYDDYGPIDYDPNRYAGCLRLVLLLILLILVLLWLSFCGPFDEESSDLVSGPSGGQGSELVDDPPTGDGADPEGDQEDGSTSSKVGPGEGEPGGDIKSVRHETTSSGQSCFVVVFYGDGEALVLDTAGWFDIIISVLAPDGSQWQANTAYFGLDPTDRGVRLGPPSPGQEKVEGATVTPTWVANDTLRTCVDGGATALEVATFVVSIGVSEESGSFWDSAEGVAGP